MAEKEKVMDSGEYMLIQQQLTIFAGLIQKLDLSGFLTAINHADTVGPIVDPTLYMKGSSNMHKIERIARAAQAFQKECEGLVELEGEDDTPCDSKI
jgi:hypothetical protein